MKRVCFACGRLLGKNPNVAVCADAQWVLIGSECYKEIGETGWQPPKGGPRLYKIRVNPDGTLARVIGLETHPLIGKPLLFSGIEQVDE